MVRVTPTAYQKWHACYQLTSDHIDLIFIAEMGPRIIHLSLSGGPNELAILPDEDMERFQYVGGHRLWHAPESIQRTYYPDNQPVAVEEVSGGVQITAPVEDTTHIQKQLTITLSEDNPHIRVEHRLTNSGLWPVELAPWAVTMCTPGGVGIMPLLPEREHTAVLVPETSLALWPYTRMNDPRWTWGKHFIMLRHDQNMSDQQKAGVFSPEGWICYANHGHLLVKVVSADAAASYPDRGCNLELFANNLFLEIETLGPLTQLEPGSSAEHCEDWHLFDDVPHPETEADVLQHIVPLVKTVVNDR